MTTKAAPTPIPESDALATTRIYGMVDQHRRANGGIGNCPNNNPSNLWHTATARGPPGNPIKPRGVTPNGSESKPNIRPKNNPPPPEDRRPTGLTTTTDEDELDDRQISDHMPPVMQPPQADEPQVRCPPGPALDHSPTMEEFMLKCGIHPHDRHTREILAQHRILRWEHFIMSNEGELLALGLTIGSARSLCRAAAALN
ncbi:hypothetical protein PGT21_010100 [Puccinia graminis f. sp. tritici]|uniref:SAM domain-containing protein n=1 Tax=Puccinia graminis f. sp. tritici TaxID=56615 RepID=A0A5B0PK82_PUCGR|nr:hypothetical protein PGT21_010100 [Puccinia graminis f. sp. tritici]